MNHEIHQQHENKPENQTNPIQEKILFKDECYAIQGAVFEVYREMGIGFLECVYQECLSKEFASRNIPFRDQAVLSLSYKGEKLIQVYKPDFICYDKTIVEIKSVKETNDLRSEPNYLTTSKPPICGWVCSSTLATTPGQRSRESYCDMIFCAVFQ